MEGLIDRETASSFDTDVVSSRMNNSHPFTASVNTIYVEINFSCPEDPEQIVLQQDDETFLAIRLSISRPYDTHTRMNLQFQSDSWRIFTSES